MVIGLLVMAVGAFLFCQLRPRLPSTSSIRSGDPAAGITSLQVAANPYVAHLGSAGDSVVQVESRSGVQSLAPSSRRSLQRNHFDLATQTSRRSGCVRILPRHCSSTWVLLFISSVRLPYIGTGLTLVLLAIAFAVLKMPTMDFYAQDIRPRRTYGRTRVTTASGVIPYCWLAHWQSLSPRRWRGLHRQLPCKLLRAPGDSAFYREDCCEVRLLAGAVLWWADL